MNWLNKLKWWQLTLLIIVFYPLGTIVGRLISDKPITIDEMLPFIVAAVFIGLITGLLAEFIRRNKEKHENN